MILVIDIKIDWEITHFEGRTLIIFKVLFVSQV